MSDGVRFFSAGPLSVFAIILLLGLIILIIPLLVFGIIGAAFTRLGFSWISALAIVLLMVLGSFVDIPVYHIRRDMIRISHPADSSVYGEFIQPLPSQVWDIPISLNLGGAVIPACVSIYLAYQAILIIGTSFLIFLFMGTIFVAVISYVATRLDPGSGIQVPILIPGLTALLSGLLLSGGVGLSAAATAFVSGIAGTLLGGNIAQLFRVNDLEASSVSIGGAGTFGAIFVCCILPALIA
ncbi:MAG: DUF1614 domain-containing protein [Methanoregula sp.]|nr:DUF1614 domain-containing protein [Methanoregula sp.]